MVERNGRTRLPRLGSLRRVTVVLFVVACIAGVIALDQRSLDPVASAIAERSATPEFQVDAKASTWFCPGVPANDESIAGQIIVSNAGESPVGGTVTRFALDGVARRERFAVPARSALELDAIAGIESSFVSALIESQGSSIVVEQRTTHRAGDAVVPCASSPSDSWYLADGFTGADSIEQVIVTNPSLDSAILDISFVTSLGERSPQSLKGVVIPPESLRVFDMAALDARNEATVAVSVRSTVGRVVVGRSQHYLGRGRLGYTMTLAASGTSTRWYFADGEKEEGTSEEFVIFNPLQNDQLLTFIVAGDDGVPLDPLTVTAPARRVTKFAPTGLGALGNGRYSTVVTATALSEAVPAGIVVERITTRQSGNSTASAVMLGVPKPARRWTAPSGTAVDAPDSLRIFNPGSVPTLIRISYLGPAGDVPIPGYEEVSLAPGGGTSIGVSGAAASATIAVTSTEPVVVQRRVSRGAQQSILGAAPLIVTLAGDDECIGGAGCVDG